MNQTHRKGRKAAKRHLGSLRRLVDRALARLDAWLEPEDEKVCDCLDPWTCGRPHASNPVVEQNPIAIDGLAPLSDMEERAAVHSECPRCKRYVAVQEWKRQCVTLKCPWCDHLVDPE